MKLICAAAVSILLVAAATATSVYADPAETGNGLHGLPPASVMGYPQGPAATPGNINVGPIEKIQTLTAGPDGTVWGVTSSGRLFF